MYFNFGANTYHRVHAHYSMKLWIFDESQILIFLVVFFEVFWSNWNIYYSSQEIRYSNRIEEKGNFVTNSRKNFVEVNYK